MDFYKHPYFDYADGVQIMIMDDPSEDSREVYYRIHGYPFIFGFGIPKHFETSVMTTINVAKANAREYAEVLFHD